ncbi:MAG TPA: fibronectin type III domain-containing protein [Gammaproteobacteria bacterium]|nr:fibronectin type III domain-containing protein [Gammaproteobacteria bacterium]
MHYPVRPVLTGIAILGLIFTLSSCGGGSGGGGGTSANAGGSGSSGTLPSGAVSVTVDWTAPQKRADGSPIVPSQIGGYRVFVGTSAQDYSRVVRVSGGARTSATIDGLASGTRYYFTVAAFDQTGLQGKTAAPVATMVN